MPQRGSQPLYPIGIVAELVDVRPETLRVWDREGLVTPKRRRGFRCYSDADLQRALFVKHLLGEEGFNVAAARGYVKLYHCWTLSDCVPCHEATAPTGKPCWKRSGAYCGLAEEEARLCSTCSERDSRATALPFALHRLRGVSGDDEPIPAAGWRPSAEREYGVERTGRGASVSENRSTVEEALDPARGPVWGRRVRGPEDDSGA